VLPAIGNQLAVRERGAKKQNKNCRHNSVKDVPFVHGNFFLAVTKSLLERLEATYASE
jgi:hypothetical protein